MKIFAVIVTYNPIIENLTHLCDDLNREGVYVILVDNSEQTALSCFHSNLNIEIINLNGNFGIANAQNSGIRYALEKSADVIVFFDQDSGIEKGFVSNLLSPIKNNNPIVLAPVFYDEQQGFEYPSFRFNKFNLLNKVYSNNSVKPYEVDVVISSGSAATIAVFEKAGLMDEDFFIDFVDIEWSIRCRKNEIPIYVVPQAKMIHSIGEKSIDIGIMRGFIHSSYRSYYKLRNPFLLLRKSHVPIILGVKEVIAAMVHQFVFMFYVKKKRTYFKIYLLAIFDGIKGIRGKN
ncbi:rhamnosyltransferase [Pedobacter helvus]|uniref:Rhamnosyltransferase n=1 Tax=Pedobacter helvus TaxID=2563444 RepID=A0ABW9JDM2_9SPHI|nr:rhamnosyltransferase [Pedobacter ureilyticus]